MGTWKSRIAGHFRRASGNLLFFGGDSGQVHPVLDSKEELLFSCPQEVFDQAPL